MLAKTKSRPAHLMPLVHHQSSAASRLDWPIPLSDRVEQLFRPRASFSSPTVENGFNDGT